MLSYICEGQMCYRSYQSMNQYYLIKKHIKGKPSGVDLAEKYVERTVLENAWFLKPLQNIRDILSELSLDSDGEIKGITKKVDKYGETYYCIEDDSYKLPNGKIISYEILKKLKSQDHVYEIRIKMVDNRNDTVHCRILMTVNIREPYFVWTYGFSKKYRIKIYYGLMANVLTNRLAMVTHNVYKAINTNDQDYIGKRGERHEV